MSIVYNDGRELRRGTVTMTGLSLIAWPRKSWKEGGERQGTAQLMAAGVKMQQEGLRGGGGSSESNNGPLLFDN